MTTTFKPCRCCRGSGQMWTQREDGTFGFAACEPCQGVGGTFSGLLGLLPRRPISETLLRCRIEGPMPRRRSLKAALRLMAEVGQVEETSEGFWRRR